MLESSERNLISRWRLVAPTVQILPTAMTCLPMPDSWSQLLHGPSKAGESKMPTATRTPDDERLLLDAFRSFGRVAASLEVSYHTLQDEVKRLRRELADSNSELQNAQAKLRREQCLAEVSALLAHEIRNPLASLELFAGLLTESKLSYEQRDWVEQMQAGLRTLSATVNNVLNLHSLPKIEMVPIDLGDLLEWARDFLAPLAKQSRITLSLQNGLSGVLFPADRHRLEQVLLNLVLNSVRATPEAGWIEIAGRRRRGEIVLTVSDTGSGIPPQDLSRIFEPGFSHQKGNPGLGLAVCRKIIEQHDGTITASNRHEGGATLTVTFPATAERSEGESR